tara:strand:- start:696 stop:1259 length:564 start_codon:yes stop_codon:yes gene_type:complete
MLNQNKIIELIISLVSIILSNMLSLYISIPIGLSEIRVIDMPITWQIPLIIFITLTFTESITLIAYSIYLVIGIFFLPVFTDGGSLGYILLPNFGYLLGIYALIKSLNRLQINKNINIKQFFKLSILGLIKMHLIGIIYIFILYTFYDNLNLLIYNIGRFTFSKLPFEILMLFPVIFLLKIKRKLRT